VKVGREPHELLWVVLVTTWVNQPQTDAELAGLRGCIARGTPFGHE
jgi:hypothetical protein